MDEEYLEIEVIDGEIVPADGTLTEFRAEPEQSLIRSSPAVQTAVAAATGFVAGAATMAFLRRYARREVLDAIPRERPPLPLRRGTYIVSIRPLVPPE